MLDPFPLQNSMPAPENQQRLGFQVSPHSQADLTSMLSNVDDLLFVLDEHGQVIHCKTRAGAESQTYPMLTATNIRDILPHAVNRNYQLALEEYQASKRFTVFEGPLTEAVHAYEFRLIPALDRQTVLFIWNVHAYKASTPQTSAPHAHMDRMITGWLRSLYLRDFETEEHTRRVTEASVELARRLGVPEQELADIRLGAQVHDIGKIAIPDEILLKTGKLTQAEWGVMRQHPLIAVDLLKPLPGIEAALVIPRSHHEKWDGSGYPDGLAGETIPLAARIFAFADVFDALTSDRPYRRAWSRAYALQYIQSEAGKHFDPSLTFEFIRLMKE